METKNIPFLQKNCSGGNGLPFLDLTKCQVAFFIPAKRARKIISEIF